MSDESKGGAPVGAALVVGGGIVGMQAALDLAEAGFKVYLVERSPAIGGNMARLDKTFPTNDCSMCTMSPRLVECGRHDNIEILTGAELVGLTGEPGHFEAAVIKHARMVDLEKCIGCGACAQSCPQELTNEFDLGLSSRAAIFKRYPQAFPNAYAIDTDQCLGCGSCQEACPADAIDLEMEDEEVTLPVGAAVLTTGFEPFDASRLGEFGYGRYPNVVTGLQFERMISASGPSHGHLQRPTDGTLPGRVAWLQCVGSRDRSRGQSWCSSVCCMYATKQALVVKEHHPEMEAAVFYIDMRAFGKDFEKYWERAKRTGIRYERCVVSGVRQKPDTKQLRLRFRTPQGELKEELFDMVVLSTGLAPPGGTRELAVAAGVDLDENGFIQTHGTHPTGTSRPGVFAAGAVVEPKDIPQAVAEASAAASEAARLLAPARNSMARTRQYPPERDVTGEDPAVGVFICHCGRNIGSVVRVPDVAECARKLDGVVHAEELLFACAQDSIKKIKERIVEHGLNRVVVASCSPRTHRPLFQETLRQAGLNSHLFEMANIRDQCSWVHQDKHDEATRKAIDLVRMAVAKARLLQPVHHVPVGVEKTALVVGGGLAGLTAAENLGGQGYAVHLVERTGELGGIARRIQRGLNGEDVAGYLDALTESVSQNSWVTLHTGRQIASVTGYRGNFVSTLDNGETIAHGVAILATGGQPYRPTEYMYGLDERIVTSLELQDKLPSLPANTADTVVFIQCTGSREPGRPYCSRVCCGRSVNMALALKEQNPSRSVFILYRDVRTYGFLEDLYARAREAGVQFIRFEPEAKPQISRDGSDLLVSVFDQVLQRELAIRADLLCLAEAILPGDSNRQLAQLFKVPLNEDGFFLEAHMKLRPVDFASEGIFMAGVAHSPKNLSENIAQAGAAASRAGSLLAKDKLESHGVVAVVETEKCAACLTCVRLCPYQAPRIKNDKAEIEPVICQGCGTCAGECPNKAIKLQSYNDEMQVALLDGLYSPAGTGEPDVLQETAGNHCA
ncbi:MAG TPA: FAD-dependent oxidoreductase [Spirochaetia bacterium]|nr:FAD-dependent oxidoreductase [Spirochaetia bacterium]